MMQHTLDSPCPVCHGTGRLAQRPQVTGYVRTQMLRLIMSHPEGICGEEIFGKLYGSDANGGPTTGIRVVSVLVWNANKQLKPQGYKIQCRWRGGRGGHSPYVLVKLDAKSAEALLDGSNCSVKNQQPSDLTNDYQADRG